MIGEHIVFGGDVKVVVVGGRSTLRHRRPLCPWIMLCLLLILLLLVTNSEQSQKPRPLSLESQRWKINFKQISARSKREVVACPPGLDFRSPGMRVFLTVSPLASTSADGGVGGGGGDDEKIVERQLELNWFNGVALAGDWVGLFDHDPTVNPLDPLDRVAAADNPGGRYRTAVSYPRPNLRDDGRPLARRCLGYWIGYVRAGATIAMDCLKMQPTWMHDLRNDIGHLTIKELMMPGTHDSGSYDEYKGRPSEDVFTRWVLTQDEPFWEQLMYGIRAFDIRVGYYSETPEVFWLNHNFVRVNPLREAIEDLRAFLNRTQEIVVLDFHQFPVGYTNRQERHSQLLLFLVQELGEHMLESGAGYGVTLDEIWRSGKRLIVAYSHSFGKTSPLLWPEISQVWANTRDPQALFHFFRAAMTDDHRAWWSSMAELTPSTLEILFGNGSLRIYADKIDQNVTEWFRDLWWNEANLVSVDFFLSTNLVDVVIESNLKRKMCRDANRLPNLRPAGTPIQGRDRNNNNNNNFAGGILTSLQPAHSGGQMRPQFLQDPSQFQPLGQPFDRQPQPNYAGPRAAAAAQVDSSTPL